LMPGDGLPSERELPRQVGVSRPSQQRKGPDWHCIQERRANINDTSRNEEHLFELFGGAVRHRVDRDTETKSGFCPFIVRRIEPLAKGAYVEVALLWGDLHRSHPVFKGGVH